MLALALLAAGCRGDRAEMPGPACPSGSLTTPVGGGYRGLLFDTHAHFRHADIPSNLACAGERLRVEASVLFAPLDPDDTFGGEARYLAAVEGREGEFLPFIDVGATVPGDVEPLRLAKVLSEVGLFFRGVGEIGFSEPPWRGRSLADDPWPSVFEFAAERDLFVMVHLRDRQAGELAAMLEAHPTTKVLLHGPELRSELPELLRAHANLFFTLDTVVLLTDGAGRAMQTGHENALAFAREFDAGWRGALERAVDTWVPVVQAAPERVMWGTDVALEWQSRPEAYGRLVAFSRAFIDRLPEPWRVGYALDNARRLLGYPTPPEPDA